MALVKPFVNCFGKSARWYCKTHYETLKIKRNASKRQIKSAFKKLSKQLHPDKNPNDPNGHLEFVKLNEAYSILSKVESRKIYDDLLNKKIVHHKKPSYTLYEDYLSEIWHSGLFGEWVQKYQSNKFATRVLTPIIAVVVLITTYKIVLILLKLLFVVAFIFLVSSILYKKPLKIKSKQKN